MEFKIGQKVALNNDVDIDGIKYYDGLVGTVVGITGEDFPIKVQFDIDDFENEEESYNYFSVKELIPLIKERVEYIAINPTNKPRSKQ